ncbi:MAG: response regulator of RpoS [Methanoregulaceae archaeon PtaB.Bin056]|jgi:twitching motility two-component system response regulator PilH|nr:MAG: response regulator of RpoS [Methanoregulaceae archaeon PtaB.Bin056]
MQKILVIDDSGFQRKIITSVLEAEGYFVMSAVNGRSGFDIAVKESPDLIICDLLMPELDGYGLLRLVREHRLPIPVLVLTSDIQKTTRAECLALGAVDVLNKPVKKEELLPALEKALGGKKRS